MVAAGHGSEDQKLFETVRAVAMDLCPQLGICIPVGKDSMSMRTVWNDDGHEKSNTAPLSLIVSAFSPVDDIRKTLTPQLQTDQGETCLLLIDLGRGKNRLAGSALGQVYSRMQGTAPDLDTPFRLDRPLQLCKQLSKRGSCCWPITIDLMAVYSHLSQRWYSPVTVVSIFNYSIWQQKTRCLLSYSMKN